MRRLLIVALLLLGSVPMLGGSAFACSCFRIPASDPDAEWRELKASGVPVYAGLVVKYTEVVPGDPQAKGVIYSIRVQRPLSGQAGPSGRVRQVRSAGSDGMCGVTLNVGRRAFVAEYDGGISSCTATTQQDVDGLVAQFLAANRPLPRTGYDPGVPLAASLALALAICAGIGSRRAVRP